jgi:hypothetical protein
MTSLQSVHLSINPRTAEWKLHMPPALRKVKRNTAMIRVGAEKNSPIRVFLSPRLPAPQVFSSKVKLINREGKIYIGPLIGILTVKHGITGFKGNKLNFIDISNMARRLGALVYVFTAEEINWGKSSTRAYLYNAKQKQWISIEDFPLPDVVYNRIPYRQDENREEVRNAIQKLRANPNIRMLNMTFFNKWDLYQALSKDHRVAKYVPETIQLKNFEEFKSMVVNHPLLYLKPKSGKAGQGIMAIESKNGGFLLRQSRKNRLIQRWYRRVGSVWHDLKRKINGNYVIQQGVLLSQHENRPFDIRVLVQKDANGGWGISGIGIRIAGKNSITTHVPRGGTIAKPEVVLKQMFSEEQYSLFMSNLREAVIRIAESLERRFEHLGELSMDIGLTQDGKIWFFEANAKPMKFDESHIRETSLKRIIEYAQYLSNFTEKGEASSEN